MSSEIILVRMCSWNTVKLADLMLSQGGGTSKCVIYRVEEHVGEVVFE